MFQSFSNSTNLYHVYSTFRCNIEWKSPIVGKKRKKKKKGKFLPAPNTANSMERTIKEKFSSKINRFTSGIERAPSIYESAKERSENGVNTQGWSTLGNCNWNLELSRAVIWAITNNVSQRWKRSGSSGRLLSFSRKTVSGERNKCASFACFRAGIENRGNL